MSMRPMVEPAAVCSRYAPCGTFSVSKNPKAVTAEHPSLVSSRQQAANQQIARMQLISEAVGNTIDVI